MYLQELWKSCLRRWYILLVCLSATAAITFLAAGVVKPTYTADASLVLVPPHSKQDPNFNRYMGLAGLEQSADVLARSLASDRTVKAITSQTSQTAKFEATKDWSTSAPMLVVTATSPVSADSEQMLGVVLHQIPVNMKRLQDQIGISPTNQIITQVISRDVEPELVQKTRFRILGALLVVLLLGSAVTVGVADGLLLRRAARLAGRGMRDGEDVPLLERQSDERREPEPEFSPPGRDFE